MLLAFDVGNSNIVIGVFDNLHMKHSFRIETNGNKSADEYGMIVNQFFSYENISMSDIDDIIISTVVPSVLYSLQHFSRKYFGKEAIVVEPGIKTGIIIKYDNPKQVGSDRIVNAVAAYHKYGGPVIIIDFGTATTFCAVSKNAEYLGGAIAPGIKIASEALFEKTAKLPKIELEDPGKAICRNTINSMQAGVVYGHMGMIKFIVEKMKKEIINCASIGCCDDEIIKVIGTGGMATMIDKGTQVFDAVEPHLTLEGLALIYEKNNDNSR